MRRVAGCRFAPGIREPCRPVAISWTSFHISRVTSGSWVGSGDQIHLSGGLSLPPFLLALLFQTMYPVYFGLQRISRTEETVQQLRARSRRLGWGGR